MVGRPINVNNNDNSGFNEDTPQLLRPQESVFFALALLSLYLLPIWIFFFEALRTGWGAHEDSQYLPWLVTLAKDKNRILGEIHQILLPLITAVSVIAFQGSNLRSILVLRYFVFANCGLVIAFEIAADTTKLLMSLDLNASEGLIISDYARRLRETLFVYFAVLLGLRLAKTNTASTVGGNNG